MRIIYRLISAAMLLVTAIAVPATAEAAETSPAANEWVTVYACPTLTGTAFPLTANGSTAPPQCGNPFAWGYTEAQVATGQAEWHGPYLAGWRCTADAWIPDNHATTRNAQYFLFDGDRYLANDAFVDQNAVSNNWTDVSNMSYFDVYDHLRVTLSDLNPAGQAGLLIAATTMRFTCYK